MKFVFIFSLLVLSTADFRFLKMLVRPCCGLGTFSLQMRFCKDFKKIFPLWSQLVITGKFQTLLKWWLYQQLEGLGIFQADVTGGCEKSLTPPLLPHWGLLSCFLSQSFHTIVKNPSQRQRAFFFSLLLLLSKV